jgi:hypothetical protein
VLSKRKDLYEYINEIDHALSCLEYLKDNINLNVTFSYMKQLNLKTVNSVFQVALLLTNSNNLRLYHKLCSRCLVNDSEVNLKWLEKNNIFVRKNQSVFNKDFDIHYVPYVSSLSSTNRLQTVHTMSVLPIWTIHRPSAEVCVDIYGHVTCADMSMDT